MAKGDKRTRRLERAKKKYDKNVKDSFVGNVDLLEPIDDEDDFCAFSFQDLHKDYTFCTKNCTDRTRLDLLSKLETVSCQSWGDLERKGKHSGFEAIPITALRKPLPSGLELKGVNKLHVLRFNSQNARLIGYRIGRVFHIVFIDVMLDVYLHS